MKVINCLILISVFLVTCSAKPGPRNGLPGIVIYNTSSLNRRINSNYEPTSISRRQPVVFPDISGMYDPDPDALGNIGPIEAILEMPDNMTVDDMSIDSLMMLSTIESASELARLLGITEMVESEEVIDNSTVADAVPDIAGRFGFSEPSTEEDAMNAVCTPERRTVELGLPREDGVLYFPRCVRLLRCGGCCSGTLLECQPKTYTTVNLKVMRIEKKKPTLRGRSLLEGRSRMRTRPRRTMAAKSVTVSEEHHSSCQCQCRVKAHQCNPKVHKHKDCNCHCMNKDEEKKCKGTEQTHSWDKETCLCVCNIVNDCSTTQFFDHSSCSCVATLRPADLHRDLPAGRSGFDENNRTDSFTDRHDAANVPITFGVY